MTRKLEADERPRWLYTATVTGSGGFPFDMLRYDSCWPRRESEDSAQLDVSMRSSREAYTEPRSINVASYHHFTPARWKSFGWSCEEDKGWV